MKKILFIAMSLKIGGAEKSLVNTLNLLDYSKWQVDLLLFQKKGEFLEQVPESVHIINGGRQMDILFQSFRTTMSTAAHHRISSFFLSLKRYFYTSLTTVKYKQFDRIRLHRWIRYYCRLIPELSGKYDVAIAYAGGETLYYMVDKVNADRKITYYHSDYSKINLDAQSENKYLKKVNSIVTISDICANSLAKLFPDEAPKIHVISNLISPTLVCNMSVKFLPKEIVSAQRKDIIVSVGRLHPIKGFDIALEAADRLRSHGKQFVWLVIGEGKERKKLEAQIKKKKLQNIFILVGSRENPYPYMKNADIIVQPSRFEGKSVVLDEAKILQKPIVVTEYHSVVDQIENMVTGVVVPITASGIADGVELLLNRPDLRNKLVENLSKTDFCVQKQVENFQNFIEGI